MVVARELRVPAMAGEFQRCAFCSRSIEPREVGARGGVAAHGQHTGLRDREQAGDDATPPAQSARDHIGSPHGDSTVGVESPGEQLFPLEGEQPVGRRERRKEALLHNAGRCGPVEICHQDPAHRVAKVVEQDALAIRQRQRKAQPAKRSLSLEQSALDARSSKSDQTSGAYSQKLAGRRPGCAHILDSFSVTASSPGVVDGQLVQGCLTSEQDPRDCRATTRRLHLRRLRCC